MTCLTLGRPNGSAYLTGELLNTPHGGKGQQRNVRGRHGRRGHEKNLSVPGGCTVSKEMKNVN